MPIPHPQISLPPQTLELAPRKKVKSLSCILLFATPWTVAYQAPPSMGFSRQEPGVGCHFLALLYSYPLSNLSDLLKGTRNTLSFPNAFSSFIPVISTTKAQQTNIQMQILLWKLCRVHQSKCQLDESQAGIKIARGGGGMSTTSDMQMIPLY